MRSDDVILQSPTSVTGATKRLLRLWQADVRPWMRWALLLPVLVVLLLTAWALTITWTVLAGPLLIPFRLWRRSVRRRQQDDLRHQELLAAARAGAPLD